MLNDPAESQAPNGMSLFILAGQSNMSGRGALEEVKDQHPHPEIWALNEDMQWRPAIDPLHWDKPQRCGVGPGLNFACTLLNHGYPGPIGLIPCAVGGTPLSRWEHGADLYERMVRWSTIAIAHGEIKAVLWHQGESDSKDEGLANSYFGRLLQMINAVRKDLGHHRLPFITGDLGDFLAQKEAYTYHARINTSLKQIAEHVPNCSGISSAGLDHIGDELHFNTESAEEMGHRYAHSYLNLIGHQWSDALDDRK